MSTACSNKALNDECQRFGNMLVVMTRYGVSFRMSDNSGFFGLYHDTHLQSINPPQAHFPSGPSDMYPQSINPPPHTSSPSLHSQNPSPSPFTHFCLKIFPQKVFRQLRTLQRKILIYQCF